MSKKLLLYQEITRICQKRLWDDAKVLASIPGCVINDSFFERNIIVTNEIIIEALKNLGVEFSKVKGRKWYQFWLNDFEVKLNNAIKLIKPH